MLPLLPWACGPGQTPGTSSTDAPDADGGAALVVQGGYGGGSDPVDGRLHVWAAVDPQRAIVTGWTGDVEWLESPGEWNGPARPPAAPATVVAVTSEVDAPVESRTLDTPAGTRRVLVAAAPDAVGVVLFFHGAAYAVDELNDNAARTLVLHLHRAGYTVIALPSTAEAAAGTGGWSGADPSTNEDLATVRALLDVLAQDGTAPPAIPRFAWGMSSGGTFAHLAGAELPTSAVAAFCAAGSSAVLARTHAPTAWHLAAEDTVATTSVADATRFQDDLRARGLATDLVVHATTRLYDERFERVEGIDPVWSARIARGLRDAGFVDADGKFTTTGGRVTSALDGVDGVADLDAAQRQAVSAEIEIMAADHELYDDTAARLVAFFDTVRTSSPTPPTR